MTEAPRSTDLEMDMNSTESSPEVKVHKQSVQPHIVDKEAAIRKFLQENYGVTVSNLKPLVGYYDLNFHVTPKEVKGNPYIDEIPDEGFFLKISNIEDSKRPELLSSVTKMMVHAQQKGIPCQETIKSISGETITQIISPNPSLDKSIKYLAVVRTFLSGQLLASLQLTPQLLYDLGTFSAQLTLALQDFHAPYFDTYDQLWNLANCPKASEIVSAVKDTRKNKMCKEVIEAFQREVLEKRKELRIGQIHGDLNEHNILMTTSGSTPKICGLLDFYDTSKSCLIFDLAICAAHLMMMPPGQMDKNVQITEIPGYLLAGHESTLELYPAERRAYRISIAARMVAALVISEHSYLQEPENLYLLNNVQCGWEALGIFWTSEADSLEKAWDQIIFSYKSRNGEN